METGICRGRRPQRSMTGSSRVWALTHATARAGNGGALDDHSEAISIRAMILAHNSIRVRIMVRMLNVV